MRYRDVLEKQGLLPVGMDEALLDSEVFLYNPENLLGTCLLNAWTLDIDGQPYVIASFTEADFEDAGPM
jgi:hypothetical protein